MIDIDKFRRKVYKTLSEINAKEYANKDKIIEIEGRTYNLNNELVQILDSEELTNASDNDLQYILVVSLDKNTFADPLLTKTLTVDQQTLGKEIYTVINNLSNEDLKLYENYSFNENEYPQFYIINKVVDMNPFEEFKGIGKRKLILKECCDDCNANVNDGLIEIKDKLISQISDMLTTFNEEELDTLADYLYNSILLHEIVNNSDDYAMNDEEEINVIVENANNDLKKLDTLVKNMSGAISGASKESDISLNEGAINHLTAKERLEDKLRRRQPTVKRALRVRRMRNKKCPPGTTWSSKTKSCTRLDPTRSRTMRRVAKFRRFS